jgi:hexokinase
MQSLTSAMTTLKKAFLAAFKTLLRGRSFLQALFAFWISPTTIKEQHANGTAALPGTKIEHFLREAERQLLDPIECDQLKWFSTQLKQQFRDRLQTHPECMLPSFNHQLPSGEENGQYLALDVGGSTLRVALVALSSRNTSGPESEIVRMDTFKITPEIKQLEGMSFFDWMASRINEVIREDVSQDQDSTASIPMGLAWSFPVE